MRSEASDLLRILGSGVRQTGAGPTPRVGGPEFAELLGKAREGGLETGLPVSVATGAGVELTPAQLDRMARIVDRAHAAGASRLLVMMDGMTLDVDVLSRRVLGAADLGDERVLTGIDGVVNADQHTADLPVALPLPGTGLLDPALQRVFGVDEGGSAA